MKKIVAIFITGALLVGFVFQSVAIGDKDKDKNSTAMTASLKGRVVDQDTGEALTGVKLKIKGEDIMTYSDFEGDFKIQGLKPGKYNIETTFISYKEKTFDNVVLELNNENEVVIKLESMQE